MAKPRILEPAQTLRLSGYVDSVVPLRDGRLVASTGVGAHIVDGDAIEALPATPLRWKDDVARYAAVVWELEDGEIRCRLQPPSSHAFVTSARAETTLFTTESGANLGAALPGRPGEVVCPAGSAVVRLDVRTGEALQRDFAALVNTARLGNRILVWTQKELVAFDLDLTEIGRRAFDFIFGVAVVGEWAVVLEKHEAIVVSDALEELDRIAYSGPGEFVVDAARGWLHLADSHSDRVSTLDINAGKMRWNTTLIGGGTAQLVVTGDLFIAFGALSARRTKRASENIARGTILNASTGGHVTSITAPGDVTQAIAIGRAGVACVWWSFGDDVHAKRAACWVDPRNDTDSVELVAHEGRFRGLCLDARGHLVSWGADGTLARWALP